MTEGKMPFFLASSFSFSLCSRCLYYLMSPRQGEDIATIQGSQMQPALQPIRPHSQDCDCYAQDHHSTRYHSLLSHVHLPSDLVDQLECDPVACPRPPNPGPTPFPPFVWSLRRVQTNSSNLSFLQTYPPPFAALSPLQANPRPETLRGQIKLSHPSPLPSRAATEQDQGLGTKLTPTHPRTATDPKPQIIEASKRHQYVIANRLTASMSRSLKSAGFAGMCPLSLHVQLQDRNTKTSVANAKTSTSIGPQDRTLLELSRHFNISRLEDLSQI
ncbi:hypothetical protein B0H14DRAFT_3165708 [Mycena olivaceomarginata]|nr:hypothetical protein B0H14DRAFT_3165708 [Mycena olivaceomarginata]